MEILPPGAPPYRDIYDDKACYRSGWVEPIALGLYQDSDYAGAEGPGDIAKKVYLPGDVDYIRMECKFRAGAYAQLITQDEEPVIYELRAPVTKLVLPAKPRFPEARAPMTPACIWIVRVPAKTLVLPNVVAWHEDPTVPLPRKPSLSEIPPEILADCRARTNREHEKRRAYVTKRRASDPFWKGLSDGEFNEWLDLHYPLYKSE
jgi:hypothetical protein